MKGLFRDKYKINSNRLKNWDYSDEAVYFLTILTKNRECLFGYIEEGKMILNENGKIIENELLKSINIRKKWFFHNWVIMPNHIHLLIEIQNKESTQTESVETHCSASTSSISATEKSLTTNLRETHCSAPLQSQSGSITLRKSNSISSFIAVFKSVTTKQINGVESIWQANYHDHIVRNYKTFEKVYDYIKNNPKSWATDSLK